MSSPPEPIRDIFEELKNEVLWLHATWTVYRQLFATPGKRLDMLHRTAAAFFFMVHKLLLSDVQMSLTKLTDPAGKRTKKNLSLERLEKQVERHDRALSSELGKVRDELNGKCEVFRTRRNKRLAHFDFDTAMKKGALPLPGVSRQMIEDALSLVREYMNTVERHYHQPSTRYQSPSMSGSDGHALVSMLKYGFRYLELLRDGKISLADQFDKGEWGDA